MKTHFGRGLNKQTRDEFERLRLKPQGKETVTRVVSGASPALTSQNVNIQQINNTYYLNTQIAHVKEDIRFTDDFPVQVPNFIFEFEPYTLYSFSGYFLASSEWNYVPELKFVTDGIDWCRGLKFGFYVDDEYKVSKDENRQEINFDFLSKNLYFHKGSFASGSSDIYLNEIEGTLTTQENSGSLACFFQPAWYPDGLELSLLEGHYSVLRQSSYIMFNKGPKVEE